MESKWGWGGENRSVNVVSGDGCTLWEWSFEETKQNKTKSRSLVNQLRLVNDGGFFLLQVSRGW